MLVRVRKSVDFSGWRSGEDLEPIRGGETISEYMKKKTYFVLNMRIKYTLLVVLRQSLM